MNDEPGDRPWRDPAVAALSHMPGLGGYPDSDLAELAALIEERRVATGTMLVEEGQPGRETYLIVEGWATVTVNGRVVGTATAGEFVGEMALLDHSPRSATVTASTPLRLFVLDAVNFAHLLTQAAAGRAIARTLAERLRYSQGIEK
jgi:CRP-like cAMP-binding protein